MSRQKLADITERETARLGRPPEKGTAEFRQKGRFACARGSAGTERQRKTEKG